jgi:CheY-like chemotaxis protein
MVETRRILYYNDPRFPSGLQELLTSRGYVLDAAQSGVELLERAVRERPVQVIAFARMPGVDGASLCKKIRQSQASQAIPVVVLSPSKENGTAFFDAGCDGYYEAPFDEIGICQRIDSLVLDRSDARKLAISRFVIDYRSNPDAFSVSVQDLQDMTLFLHSKNPLDEGASLKLSLSVAGKTLMDAYGDVIRSEPFRGFSSRPTGMAIRFRDLDEAAERFLAALTRQHLLAGKGWQETPAEIFMDRIAAQVRPGAESVRVDPILRQSGFERGNLRFWEAAAFAFAEDESADVELNGAIREAVGLSQKIRYHTAKYGELVYLDRSVYDRLHAHSEQLLTRGDAVGDVLLSLADASAGEALGASGEQLAETQADLLQRMVELRTVMGAARQSAESVRTITDDELCPEPEVKIVARGLAEIFDFIGGGPLKADARRLNPELDLSELANFEVLCLMEARQPANAIHPNIGAWARALIARHVHISEFLRYRRPGREVRADRVQEVLQFCPVALEALLAAEERYRREIVAIAGAAREHLEELAATNHRTLLVAARLCEYYNVHAEVGGHDYGPDLAAAAEAAFGILPTAQPAAPLPVGPPPGAGGVDLGGSEQSSPSAAFAPVQPPPSARPEPLRRLQSWFEGVGRRRAWLVLAAVLLLAGGGVALYFALSGPKRPPQESRLDIGPFLRIVPLSSCEMRDSVNEKGVKKRTLRCLVQDSWTKRPQAVRKKSLKDLFAAARDKNIRLDQLLLLDGRENAAGYTDGVDLEVYDR